MPDVTNTDPHRVCGGFGYIVDNDLGSQRRYPCPACGGTGRVPHDPEVTPERILAATYATISNLPSAAEVNGWGAGEQLDAIAAAVEASRLLLASVTRNQR
jgi:hypothetical protein